MMNAGSSVQKIKMYKIYYLTLILILKKVTTNMHLFALLECVEA